MDNNFFLFCHICQQLTVKTLSKLTTLTYLKELLIQLFAVVSFEKNCQDVRGFS